MRLQLKIGSKAYLHVACIVTLKMPTPMSSFYSFNKASNFKPSSPNSLSKQYCVFKKVRRIRNVDFALKFNQYKGYMILVIHELVRIKSMIKFFNEINYYN
jgi:hypothetical protein